MILALDPGPVRSALVLYDARVGLCEFYLLPNADIRTFLARYVRAAGDILVVEQIAAMGMAVGGEVFETCFESGRFVQAWGGHHAEWARLKRVPIKVHLCGTAKAKDANVRRVLMDRFGGDASIKKEGTTSPPE